MSDRVRRLVDESHAKLMKRVNELERIADVGEGAATALGKSGM